MPKKKVKKFNCFPPTGIKRFLLFYGDWEAKGGWYDFSNDISFETLEEAIHRLTHNGFSRDWGHIVDLNTLSIVFECHSEASQWS